MIEPGKTGAYLALFSEIGLVLFVLTLGGALGGHWLDEQLGIRFPIFLLKACRSAKGKPKTWRCAVGVRNPNLISRPRITWISAQLWAFLTSSGRQRFLVHALES